MRDHGSRLDGPAVSRDDRAHDRQTEPGTAAVPAAARVGTNEPVEDPVAQLVRNARPAVLDEKDDLVPAPFPGDVHGGAFGRVLPHVRQEVVEHLPEPPLITVDDERAASELEPVAARVVDHPRRIDGVVDQNTKIDGLAIQRARFVEPGEEQQVFDEPRHALALALDRRHRLCEIRGVPVGATPKQLGIAADRRQRSPKLVRRIGEEPAKSLLGRITLCERRLDLLEHPVDRARHATDLGTRRGGRNTLGEVAGGNRVCGRGDAEQWSEALLQDEGGNHRERRQDDCRNPQVDREQVAQGFLLGGQ